MVRSEEPRRAEVRPADPIAVRRPAFNLSEVCEMHRACLVCGHEFLEDLVADDPSACPVCDSNETIELEADDATVAGVNEEDLEGIDDGVWQ